MPKTSAASDLGSSTQNWQSLYLDNDSTDGGAIYFDAGTTEYIKASADGTELDLGGFTYFDMNSVILKNSNRYYEAKSDSYTVTDSDGVYGIFVTTGASNRTVTLPTAANNNGRELLIKKVDSGSGTVIIDGEGAETIDGVATHTLVQQYDYMKIICNSTTWFVTDYGFATTNKHGSIQMATDVDDSRVSSSDGTAITTTQSTLDSYTIVEAGKYLCIGTICARNSPANSTNVRIFSYLEQNSTNLMTCSETISHFEAGAEYTTLTAHAVVDLSASDVVNLDVSASANSVSVVYSYSLSVIPVRKDS